MAPLQVIILPDAEEANEITLVGQLQAGLFIGPVLTLAKQEAIDRKKTFVPLNRLEKEAADFIGPVNIHYYKQRGWTFRFCKLLIVEPHPLEWSEASNSTRLEWENWWEACTNLVTLIESLPFNYEQVAPIRELDLKLNECFRFFEKRKEAEDFHSQVKSRTRSGKRC